MCGRFQLSVKGKHISERYNTEVFDAHYKPAYNCAPTQRLPVITNEHPEKLCHFFWGLVPSWAKDTKMATKMINARAETIAEKPAFKKAFSQRRCLIPANGFYEWRTEGKAKIPFRFFMKNETVFSMAGIWEIWYDSANNPLHSFSIITTDANTLMEKIHHRMPVILSLEGEKLWLSDKPVNQLQNLLRPFPETLMDCYPVSPMLNKAANDGSELAEPYTAQQQGQIPGLFD